jgi:hypothetical protein
MGYDAGADYAYAAHSIVSVDLYSVTIFNRYALYECTDPACTGTFGGSPYTSSVIPTSQGQTANRGVELTLNHQPKYGFGYRVALDLLRDYSYDQIPVSEGGSLFLGPLPDNGVQLPGYQYSKIRTDWSYGFKSGENFRIGTTSYGANNYYGRPGFTVVDTALTIPGAVNITLGATNVLNKDNGATGGLYFGGYTYQGLGGTVGPTNWEFAQPRTVYFQTSVPL